MDKALLVWAGGAVVRYEMVQAAAAHAPPLGGCPCARFAIGRTTVCSRLLRPSDGPPTAGVTGRKRTSRGWSFIGFSPINLNLTLNIFLKLSIVQQRRWPRHTPPSIFSTMAFFAGERTARDNLSAGSTAAGADEPARANDGGRPPAWVINAEASPDEFEDIILKFNTIADAFGHDLDSCMNKSRIARAFHGVWTRAEALGLPDRETKRLYAAQAARIAIAAASVIERRWEYMLRMRKAAKECGIVFKDH